MAGHHQQLQNGFIGECVMERLPKRVADRASVVQLLGQTQ
jgi:hypothetical protein